MHGGEIGAVLGVIVVDRGNGHQAADAEVFLRSGSVQQGPELLRRNAGLRLLAADIHFQQNVLHKARLGGFPLDGGQQVLAVNALDQAGAAQHLF